MTTQEFWEKYKKENILKIYDDIKHFFSEKLPADFITDYDYGEVVLEVQGHYAKAKKFEKVLEFTKILQTKQPRIYEELHEYFDDFLIDYYCFHNQVNMLEQPVKNFFSDLGQGIDNFLMIFKKLLYYQQIDLVDSIANMYQKIETSPAIMGNAGHGLAFAKMYIELEKQYNGFLDNGRFTWENFADSLEQYDFDFEADFLSSLEKGFAANNLSIHELKELLENGIDTFPVIIEGYFLKSMLDKGFSFPLSGKIWDEMLDFWINANENEDDDLDSYFCMEYDAFAKFLNKKSGSMFLDKSSDIAAIIWSAQYVYDFLKENGIINQETYDNAFEIINIQKAKVISNRLLDLWNYNFTHTWKKPDSISQSEFEAEHNIFKKSYSLKPTGSGQNLFNTYREEINEEINQMIILKPFILELDLYEKKYEKRIEDQPWFPYNTPYVAPPKTGRNEPCPCGSGKKYKKCCGK